MTEVEKISKELIPINLFDFYKLSVYFSNCSIMPLIILRDIFHIPDSLGDSYPLFFLGILLIAKGRKENINFNTGRLQRWLQYIITKAM